MNDAKLLNAQTESRAFTFKSIIFSLIGIAVIAGTASFNDNRLSQNLMIGNHFPVGGYFLLFLFAILYNPIAGLIHRGLAMNYKELCVVHGLTLAACWVPTSGMFRYFHRQLIMPWYFLDNMKNWKKWDVMSYLPEHLFPLGGKSDHADYDLVYNGFVQGLAKGNEWLWDIPLEAWHGPMKYWFPILIAFAVMMSSLALMLHRQWVHHEQISYPLASVASSLFKRDDDSPSFLADVFRSKLFWMGCLPVLTIYLFKILAIWNPGVFPDFQLNWWMKGGIDAMFPTAGKVGLWAYGKGTLLFAVVGLTYFISTGTAFSLAFADWILVAVLIQFVHITGGPMPSEHRSTMQAGSYFMYALILIYTGRHYYGRVLMRALGVGKDIEPERVSVHAARIFLLASLILWGLLTTVGELDWFLAGLYTLGLALFYMVFTRIVCETGVPFLQANFNVGSFMPKLFGISMVGPKAIVMLNYFATIFTADPRECLMPYVATGLKVADDAKVNMKKMLHVTTIGIAGALILGFMVTILTFYNFGAAQSDPYATNSKPKHAFNAAEKHISELSALGGMEASQEASGLGKLALFQMDSTIWPYFITGGILVLVVSLLRFRFSGFPLHPVIFLVWGTYAMGQIWASIMIGFIIKLLIVRFGGGKAFENLKPLFIGLVMGELIACGTAILFGFVYYFVTGNTPVGVRIFAG